MPARLHFIGGEHQDVDAEPEEVAKALWAQARPRAGYGSFHLEAAPVLVNPAAVSYVTRLPGREAFAPPPRG